MAGSAFLSSPPPSKRTHMSDSSLFLSPPSSNGASANANKRAKSQPLSIPTGHAAVRLLCHTSLIGGIIGKSGSSIKQLQLDTGSKIRVEDSLQLGSDDRVIVIVAPNVLFKKVQLRRNSGEVGFEVEVSAVQEAALRVFEKVLEVSGEVTTALCKVLVGEKEASSVIGKGGKTVEKLKRETGAKIRVLSRDQLPSGISSPDEVVEIEGDALAVKRALLGVCRQLLECPQAEKSSMKESRPLESTSQPLVHDFYVDPTLHRTPLSVATTSCSPAMTARPLLYEADRLPALETKFQQEEVVFKFLCSNDRVGGVIGRGGSIIKALQDESGASINVGSSVANSDERLITISSKEDVESRYSPAQRAVVLVFNRSVEAAAERGLEGLNKGSGSSVSARLIVPSNQVGCLLGKGGAIISEMRKATGASISIMKGDQVSKCAAQDDDVVEISGSFVNTQDALYQITGKLRNHFFTGKTTNYPGTGMGKVILETNIHGRARDVTPMSNGQIISESSIHGRARDMTPIALRQSSGTSPFIDSKATLRQGWDPVLRPRASEHIPSVGFRTSEPAGVNPRSFVTPVRPLASANGVEHGRTQRPAIVTNTTVEILVPESSISSVYGENGSNLSRIRQISGAQVIVHNAVRGSRNRSVVISGTPDETQAAQSLIHAFILTGSS